MHITSNGFVRSCFRGLHSRTFDRRSLLDAVSMYLTDIAPLLRFPGCSESIVNAKHRNVSLRKDAVVDFGGDTGMYINSVCFGNFIHSMEKMY